MVVQLMRERDQLLEQFDALRARFLSEEEAGAVAE
jgi:hypothetical protein